MLWFACSIWLRLGELRRPLMAHGWVTAHVMIVLENLSARGVAAAHFAPAVTYPGPGDQGIGWEGYTLLEDAAGTYYHASYPVLGYLAPYFALSLANGAPSAMGLQIFGLLLGATTALFIFLVIERLAAPSRYAALAAAAGAGLFITVPGAMWFQGPSYFVDMQALPLLTICLYGLLRIAERPDGAAWWLFSAASIFLLCFTEYIGFLYIGCVYGLYLWTGEWRTHWRGLLLLGVAGALALGLDIVLLARIRPWTEVLSFLALKFTATSGVGISLSEFLADLRQLGSYYRWYTGPLWAAAGGVALLHGLIGGGWRHWFQKPQWRILFLAVAPVALHVVLLFGFNSHHGYSTLKLLPFLAIVFGVLAARLLTLHAPARLIRGGLAILVALCVARSLNIFYSQAKGMRGEADLVTLGQDLAKLVQPEQVLVMQTNFGTIEPRISYGAKRSILYYQTDEAVHRHLQQYGLKEAVIVSVTDAWQIAGVRPLSR